MTIRVALVGLDHWYNAIPLAEAMARSPDVTLAAVADPDLARAAELASRMGAERVESDYRRVVESPAVDAVVSMGSVDRNPAVCCAAAGAGKHVLSNKPIARTLDEASKVAESVTAAGVHLLPGESRPRLGRRVRALRNWASSGDHGRLCHASASTWVPLPQSWPGDTRPGWFADPTRTVGGAWIEHAIYQVDALRWALGTEVMSVSGTMSKLVHTEVVPEDYGIGIMTFTDGLVAALENTWTAPAGCTQTSFRLTGIDGMFEVNGITDRQLVIERSDAGQAHWYETAAPAAESADAVVAHLVSLIRGETGPVATVHDAWANLAACLAFYQSASQHSPAIPSSPP